MDLEAGGGDGDDVAYGGGFGEEEVGEVDEGDRAEEEEESLKPYFCLRR